MSNFEVKLNFPVDEYECSIEYTKVAKPTGISYILLSLINEGFKDNLVEILNSIQITPDLHPIFNDELYSLLKVGIIKSKVYQTKRDFSKVNIDDIKFTDNGRKLFSNRYMYSGNPITYIQKLYYNHATKELLKDKPNNYNTTKYFKKYDTINIDEYEDRINSFKSDKFKVKKEELILNTTIDTTYTNYIKEKVSLSIKDNDVVFNMNNKKLEKFIATLSKEKVSDMINSNSEFECSKLNKISLTDVKYINVYKPNEYEKKLNTKAIYTVDYKDNNNKYSFVKFNENGSVKGFILKQVNINDYNINLLLEVNISKEETDLIINNEFKDLTDFNKDTLKLLNTISTKFNSDIKDRYINNNINKDLYTTINNLRIIKEVLPTYDTIKVLRDITNIELDSNYIECTKDLFTKDYSEIKKVEFYLNYASANKETYLLLSKYFKEENILPHINLVKEFTKDNNYNTNVSNIFKNLNNNLDILKTELNIHDITKYTVSDNYNAYKVIEAYNTLHDLFNRLSSYRVYDENYFKEVESFKDIFLEKKKVIETIVNSNKDPKTIKKDQIDKYINKAEVYQATTFLSAKLEYILNKKFGKADLVDNIKKLSKEDLVDKKDIKYLNELREIRNTLLHSNNNKVSFKNLNEYSNIIFKMEVEL